MGHESFSRDDRHPAPSNRAFGLLFAVIFVGAGLLPALAGQRVWHWLLLAGATILLVALAAPSALSPLNALWTRLGALLHSIVSPIALAFMFFLVVTPIGLLMRLLGKDPLRLRFDPGATSYWMVRDPPGPAPETLTDQF